MDRTKFKIDTASEMVYYILKNVCISHNCSMPEGVHFWYLTGIIKTIIIKPCLKVTKVKQSQKRCLKTMQNIESGQIDYSNKGKIHQEQKPNRML
jgi:hypothetical protein